jgi:hypothetical protein
MHLHVPESLPPSALYLGPYHSACVGSVPPTQLLHKRVMDKGHAVLGGCFLIGGPARCGEIVRVE